MATESKAGSGDFLNNLGKVYGIYAGGFLAFVAVLAVLEQIGVPDRVLGYLFVGFTILVYAIIGVLSRTAQVSEYYVAGRKVPAFYNGMATGADWMSAASFVGMAGTLYALGYDGLAFVLGWTGGFVLVSVLAGAVPAQIRRLYGPRLPGRALWRQSRAPARRDRAGFLLLHLCGGADLRHRHHRLALPRPRFHSCGLCRACRHSGLCSMLGGMRAVTWTQVAQYIVLIVAYLTFLSSSWRPRIMAFPIPQITVWPGAAGHHRA